MKRLIAALLLSAAALAQSSNPSGAANVVRYKLDESKLKYLFATSEPVLHLKPGDILETNTVDAFGNAIQKPGDTLSMVKGDNPLTGPFHIDGAEPGDTLAVKILDLQVDGKQGIGTIAQGFGALNSTTYTPMVNAPIGEKIWFYPIDAATNTATFQALDSSFKVSMPLHPFLGCIGWRPPAARRAAPSCPPNSAATWIRRKPAPATPSTSR
jgi:amidase